MKIRSEADEKYWDVSGLMSGLSVDCVVFGFTGTELKVLLLKLKTSEKYALPGGFIPKDEALDTVAKNLLRSRTGLEDLFLCQFKIFGELGRNVNNYTELDTMVYQNVMTAELRGFFNQRFVSVGYYALVKINKVVISYDQYFDDYQWMSVENIPQLFFDHNAIISDALAYLRKSLIYQPIGINLLEDEFTLVEYQTLYEAILGRKLDARNFRRKMNAYGFLIDTGKKRKGGQHRSPRLYRIDKDKYEEANRVEFENLSW